MWGHADRSGDFQSPNPFRDDILVEMDEKLFLHTDDTDLTDLFLARHALLLLICVYLFNLCHLCAKH